MKDLKNQQFFDYNTKIQIWIKLLIETGDYIDYQNDEPFWGGFFAFEKAKDSSLRRFAGFTNFYTFNLSMEKCRYRLCQTFVLPNHQKMGLGYLMLEVSLQIVC